MPYEDLNIEVKTDVPAIVNIDTNVLLGPKGEKGDKGDRGTDGPAGPANNLAIGTVERGEEADATITGETPNQILNLVLPKGDKGETGNSGVEISETTPIDPEIKVWIDPTGEATRVGSAIEYTSTDSILKLKDQDGVEMSRTVIEVPDSATFSNLIGSPYDNTALANALNAKQATITDLASIRTGASKGNTAIQPNDNVSELENDADYQNATQVGEAIGIHNASSTAHADIRQDISDVESIAKGAQQGVAFTNYNNMIQNINAYAYDKFIIGQSVYIGTLQVPDLWVSAKFEENQPYTYISDEKFIEDLDSGFVRVGRFNLSKLETGKVDLTDYVKNTDYATTAKVGVVKVAGRGLSMLTGGQISITPATTAQIDNKAQLYNPITPTTLDYSVKVSVTTNEIALSEQEQTSARNWLGATLVEVIDND